MTVTALTLMGLLLSQPEPAGARQERPLNRAGIAVTTTSSSALSEALDSLPDNTAAAIIIAAPLRLGPLEALWEELAAGAAVASAPLVDELLVRTFGADPPALLRPLKWASIGLDGSAPLIVVPGFGRSPSLFRARIGDRTRLDAWLSQLPHDRIRRGEESTVELLGEGLACVISGRALYCQRGSSGGANPLAEVLRWAEQPSRRLSHVKAVSQVAERVGGAMDAWAIVQPGLLAPSLVQASMDRAAQEAAFKGPAAKNAAMTEARRTAQRWATWAGSIQAIATGARLRAGQLETAVEAELDDRLAATVEDAVGRSEHATAIERWASTPALARAFVHLDRTIIADGLRAIGLELPAEAVGGTAALLLLGVDAECPLARSEAPPELHTWPAVLPLALAIGLSSRAQPANVELAMGAYNRQRRERALEVHLEGDALLFASGPGGLAAATRRFGKGAVRGRDRPGTFADASIDLAAVGAALSAANLESARPELRSLNARYQRLRPALERFRVLELRARAEGAGHRLRVEALAGP